MFSRNEAASSTDSNNNMNKTNETLNGKFDYDADIEMNVNGKRFILNLMTLS